MTNIIKDVKRYNVKIKGRGLYSPFLTENQYDVLIELKLLGELELELVSPVNPNDYKDLANPEDYPNK